MRIYDCVIVTSESDLDLLEARFREFADVDAVHVIAECPAAYDQSPKPLHFYEQRKDRFASWHGRWNHIRVEASEIPSDVSPAERKEALREWLKTAITGEPDDIVLHGAVGEIPSAAILLKLDRALLPVSLEMRMCAYRLNLVHPRPWRGTAALRRRDVDSFTALRKDRFSLPALINAGTRLAAMGQEPPAPPQGAARKGLPLYEDGRQLRQAVPDESFPRYARDGCPASWLPPGGAES